MKKIITGLFFRLIKGFEIWALIALLIWSSAVIDKIIFANVAVSAYRDDYIVGVSDSNGPVSSKTIVSRRFEYTGVSASDLYRRECEPVINTIDDPDVYEHLFWCDDEVVFICSSMGSRILAPAVLMVLFIPVFFGKLFSDGTLKNYIACGHSKGTIYFASLLFCFALDVFMVFLNFLIFAGWCLYYAWKPPIYLPVLLVLLACLLACSMLLLFSITSICLAFLLASHKRALAFIAGFILVPCLLFTNAPTALAFEAVFYSRDIIEDENYDKYLNIYRKNREEGIYLQPYLWRLELSDLSEHIYYEEEIDIFAESNLNPAVRCALELAIFMNPASVYQFTFSYEGSELPPYMICRDGLAAVNIACNIFWITLSSGIGVSVFRKREVAS
ncbi:MAG: hypothetical protein IKM96_01095 [Clostridiales bacterium]|nr:hypothetical protein [Clostridiales bacterium]